jgi:hypothetical protein
MLSNNVAAGLSPLASRAGHTCTPLPLKGSPAKWGRGSGCAIPPFQGLGTGREAMEAHTHASQKISNSSKILDPISQKKTR